jgi:hypothetical protein
LEVVWLSHPPSVEIFKEQFYENLAFDPMYFSSKRKLRAELKERGLTMPYVE